MKLEVGNLRNLVDQAVGKVFRPPLTEQHFENIASFPSLETPPLPASALTHNMTPSTQIFSLEQQLRDIRVPGRTIRF